VAADDALAREGFEPEYRRFLRTADLRYYGQAFEVRVAVPDGPVTAGLLDAVADAFHAEHRALYGYDFRGDQRQEVEWVNLRVTGIGPIRTPSLPEVRPGAGADRARSGVRQVYYDDWTETSVYQRAALGAGDVVAGPAIIEEFGSTVPIHPGFAATVDRHGNLRISRPSGPDSRATPDTSHQMGPHDQGGAR
jgi:N-methylhydantoinase A